MGFVAFSGCGCGRGLFGLGFAVGGWWVESEHFLLEVLRFVCVV